MFYAVYTQEKKDTFCPVIVWDCKNIISEQEKIDFLENSKNEAQKLHSQEEIDTFRIINDEEYCEIQKNFYLSKPLIEITKDRYYDMLGVLPPKKWETNNGVESFCLAEMEEGSFCNQFATKDGKYYEKTVDIFDKSTWIHNML